MDIRKDTFWRVEKKDSHYAHRPSSKPRQLSTVRYLSCWRSKVSALFHHKTFRALVPLYKAPAKPWLLNLPSIYAMALAARVKQLHILRQHPWHQVTSRLLGTPTQYMKMGSTSLMPIKITMTYHSNKPVRHLLFYLRCLLWVECVSEKVLLKS